MTDYDQAYPYLSNHFAQQLSVMSNDNNKTLCSKESALLWRDIATRYSEPVRAYHTLAHLQQLFNQFEIIHSKLNQPHIIALALFYHDVIYDPTQANNELKSAEYVVNKLSKFISYEQCQRIYALIMMTASHNLEDTSRDSSGSILDSDAAYLLDMDLSILGAEWFDYEQYSLSVRQEYAHVANDDYRLGRVAVLERLLAHDRLYLTDYYYERYEQSARLKIRLEIENLQ